MDALDLINYFYPDDTDLKKLLLQHSFQVRDKALALAQNSTLALDLALIQQGALLHDIGIGQCHAPSICCHGTEHYLRHGILGAQMLREYGRNSQLDLEPYARICERHTGAGLTAADIVSGNLPLPVKDYLPETMEEKLICLADKFFSKSGDLQEKSLESVRRSMSKFGPETLARFDALAKLFTVQQA